MDRREFFRKLGGSALLAGAGSLLSRPAAALPEKLTLTAVGDCIISRKISRRRDPRFIEVVELLRSADCAWANCEMVFCDPRKAYPAPKGIDMNLICEPWGADELNWLGIDAVGCANNHSLDYGREGLLSTMENLNRVGIAFAGVGIDLQEASRPRYVDTPGGRIGQVNCAANFPDFSVASYSHPHVNGRAGLNPLRFSRVGYTFDEELFQDAWELSNKFRQATGRKPSEKPPASGRLSFLGMRITKGENTEITAELNQEDLERITRAIAIARRNSRLVLATIHSHEGFGSGERPQQFMRPFAKACIDAGADAFFGSGPHMLRGIEIYQGKPIFYSLGNFLFQYETVKQIPPETLTAYELEYDAEDPSLFTDKYFFPKNNIFWESVVPYITFDKGQLSEILLYPIVLGQKLPRYQRGTPLMATREEGQSIMESLAKLSKPFGTALEYKEGIGRVNL